MKILAIAGVICIVLAGWMSADLVSSSIAVDGTAWISSAITGDTTYASHLFTNDRSVITRDLASQNGIDTDTRLISSGPVALDEFTSRAVKGIHNRFTCVFTNLPDSSRYDELATSGLWSSGAYTSSRRLDEGVSKAGTIIAGDGMVSLSRISETPNQTYRERGFIAGDMNLSEYMESGDA